MSKLWVSVLFVLLLAVLLTVGLTVAFVYKGKREKKEEKITKPLWVFHVEPEDLTKEKEPKALTLDLERTSDYTVDGHKVSLAKVSHTFGQNTIEGYTHLFKDPLRVTRVVVDGKDLTLLRPVLSSGFTVFHKESKPDFVTLWHDGDFRHYTPKGELLTIGVFPFAEEDHSVHPNKMDLPRGKDVGKTVRPVPEPVVTPEEPAKPKEGEPEKPKEGEPEKPKEGEPEKPVAQKVVLDLDLALSAEVGKTFTYTEKEHKVTITGEEFGPYLRHVYTLEGEGLFTPHLKLGSTIAELPDSTGAKSLESYRVKGEVPLVVAYRDSVRTHTWSHRGENFWESTDVPAVTVDFIDDAHCFIHDLISYDLSRTSGKYMSGSFDVAVTEVPRAEVFEGFRCFVHKQFRGFAPGSPSFRRNVSQYRFKSLVFTGITEKTKVSSVTACFWERNLTKPLLLRVKLGDLEKDFVGYKSYSLVERHETLRERILSVNMYENRVVNLNLSKHESYDFTGDRLSATSPLSVQVKSSDNTPLASFRKTVHKLELTTEDKEPFFVENFHGVKLPTVYQPLHSVEAYYHKDDLAKPLLVTLKGALEERHYCLLDGEHKHSPLIRGKLDITLRFLAYDSLRYVKLDLTKMDSYFFTGDDLPLDSSPPTVVVKKEEGKPEDLFLKTTHTVEKDGKETTFNVLEYAGTDIPVVKDLVQRVEAYYLDKYHDSPLAVFIYRVNGMESYGWDMGKYVQKGPDFRDKLQIELGKTALIKHGTLKVDLSTRNTYFLDPPDQYKVEIIKGEINPGFTKYSYKFHNAKDPRFVCPDRHLHDPKIENLGKEFTSAELVTNSDDKPVLVKLTADTHSVHFSSSDLGKTWDEVDNYVYDRILELYTLPSST